LGEYINLSSTPYYDGFYIGFDSGQWTQDGNNPLRYKYWIIPIQSEDVITIKPNSSKHIYCAILTEYPASISAGMAASFSSDINYNHKIDTGSSIEIICPSDAHYLYLEKQHNTAEDMLQTVNINGYNILNSVQDNIAKIESNIDENFNEVNTNINQINTTLNNINTTLGNDNIVFFEEYKNIYISDDNVWT